MILWSYTAAFTTKCSQPPPPVLFKLSNGEKDQRKGGSFMEVVQSPWQLSRVRVVLVLPENVPQGAVQPQYLSVQDSCLCACRYLYIINKGGAELVNYIFYLGWG